MKIRGIVIREHEMGMDHLDTYRGYRTADGLEVRIHVIDRRSSQQSSRRRDHDLLRARTSAVAESPHLIGAAEQASSADSLVLVEPIIEPITLADYIHDGPLPWSDATHIAIDVAGGLAALHGLGVVHGALCPRNVCISPRSLLARIPSLGSLAGFRAWRKYPVWAPSRTWLGPYSGPEKLGRLARPVDERSDLYGLGAVLYELATGVPPFDGRDQHELSYHHIAHPPGDPRELEPTLPAPLSAIILRLLAKDPDDRFASANQVIGALKEALTPPRAPSRRRSHRTVTAHEVVGRETERARIEAFASAHRARGRIVIVAGPPGMGASALGRQVAHTLSDRPGETLITVRDVRSGDGTGILRAIGQQLVAGMLRGDPRHVGALRARLLEALGPLAHVLVRHIPTAGALLGVGRSPGPAPGQLRAALARLLRAALAARGHDAAGSSLVLLVDDLYQPAPDELAQLRALLEDVPALAIITTRLRAGDLPGPLEQLRQRATTLAHLSVVLAPLTPAALGQVVGASVAMSTRQARALHRLGAGNPGVLHALLGQLQADARSPARLPGAPVDELPLPAAAAELVAEGLTSMTPAAQAVAALLATVGGPADASIFEACAAAELGRDAAPALRELIGTGAVRRRSDVLSFAHAEVGARAAELDVVAALGRDVDRAAVHLRFADALCADPSIDLDARACEIADHLNAALPQLRGDADRRRTAELDLLAARRAHREGRHEQAARYASLGLRALGAEHVPLTGQLATDLVHLLIECDLRVGDTRAAKGSLALARALGSSSDGRAHLCAFELRRLMRLGQWEEGMSTGLRALAELGTVVLAPGQAIETTATAAARSAGFGADGAGAAARSGHATLLLRVHLLAVLAGRPERDALLPQLWQRAVEERDGDLAAYVRIHLAGALAARGGDLDVAEKLASMARAATSRDPLIGAAIRLEDASRVLPHHRPVRASLPVLEESFALAADAGEPELASAAREQLVVDMIVAGDPIPDWLDVGGSRPREPAGACAPVLALGRALRGEPGATDSAPGHADDIAPLAPATARARLLHGYLAYLEGDPARALAELGELDLDAPAVRGTVTEAHARFVRALAALHPAQRDTDATQLDGDLRALRAWRDTSPSSWGHRALLVDAERARRHGETIEALYELERAVTAARRSGHLGDLAVACERSASFHAAHGNVTLAAELLRAAVEAYRGWGALARAAAVARDLAPGVRLDDEPGGLDDDLVLLADAVERLRESAPEDLEAEVLGLAMRLTGAERGALIVEAGERVTTREAGRLPAVHLGAAASEQLAQAAPRSLINYVANTRTRTIVADAATDTDLHGDPYVPAARPRSMLCQPIVRADAALAVLYLEHRSVADLFTARLATTVGIFASQAALALDNAQLRARPVALALRADDGAAAPRETLAMPGPAGENIRDPRWEHPSTEADRRESSARVR